MIQFVNKPFMMTADAFEAISLVEWLSRDSEKIEYGIENGVAVIPIYGVLTKRDEMWEDTCSYERIKNTISDALADESVKAILLDIDSPGGEVGGLFDLVNFISRSKKEKPICSYVNDQAFSAAYAIACATDKIFINELSGVGSIGVIASHVSVSEAEKKAGIKYTTVYAGAKKNDLSPHEELSEGAISDLQKEVNRLYMLFVNTVAVNRQLSAGKVIGTEAGCFYGQDGIDMGLADEFTADPINRVIERFGVVPSVSVRMIGGDEMTDEIKEEEKSMTNEYREQVLEISKLCKIAHASERIVEFLEQNMSVEDVKKALLSAQETKEEIASANYHKGTISCADALLEAARKRVLG